VKHTLNLLALEVREQALPGSVWWTDISHQFPQDFEGNCYARLFAEELTAYAIQYYCPNKSSLCLVAQLEQLERWVTMYLPGSRLGMIRCDFGSEYARQGHGDDRLTQALQVFFSTRPGFRVRPVAPRAQAYNKAELVIQQVTGNAYVNACRARLGPTAWSLMHWGAVFQHIHRVPHRSADALLCTKTRSAALHHAGLGGAVRVDSASWR
jgi:hypothetical protein